MQQLSCDIWLMERTAMRQFRALAASNISVDLEQVRASAPQQRRQKSVAILPIHGVIEARPTFMGQLFGMTSYEAIGRAFDQLVADESVSGIILDVASPGGMAYGAPELAQKIFSARGTKPIISVANPLAASGAYWIASAADRLVVTPSGDVGSVGVICEHVDVSKALEAEGTTVTVIRSSGSPYKAETNDMEPLSDEARQNLQSRADEIYQNFVSDLARFRGVSVGHVNQNFGQGRTVGAKAALSASMVDRVWTADEVAYKMAAGRIRLAGSQAADEWNAPTVHDTRRLRAAEVAALCDAGTEG